MSSKNSPSHELASSAGPLAAPSGADPTHFLPKADPTRYLGVLLSRGWIVMLCSVLGAAGLLFLASRMEKTYLAKGSVYIGSQAPMVLDIQAVSPEGTKDLEEMRSVEQRMSSSTLLMRVIKAMKLDEDPVLAAGNPSDEGLVNRFAARVGVGLRRGTRIIDVTVEDADPERARRLVEALVDEYENWTSERQREITELASEGLRREEARLRAEMEESARRLQEFRVANPVPGLERSAEGSVVSDALGALNSELTQATAERLRLEAEYETYVKFDASDREALAGIEKTERGQEVLGLVRSLREKESEFGRVKERYLYKHPVYREVAGEIRVLEEQLAQTVREAGQALEKRYEIARENEIKLASKVAEVRGAAVTDEGVREQFRAMTREAETDRELYESVSKRLRETTLAATVPASVLRWEDTPMTPEKPHSPRKGVFALLGVFAGFLLGVVLMVGAELGDRKVRNAAAAARATGTPLLASLPAIGNPGNGMLLMSDPDSPGAEAFRRLGVVLAPQPGANSGRTVLFTSAEAGEGKSFCALNHATSLAMQGYRTLLLDADMRGVGLSREHIANGGVDEGLGGYLAGRIEPASACHASSLPNLYVLSSGPMRGDAAELLAGTRFPSLLEDAYRWFDRVVIDTPPVLSVSDAQSIARYADRCVLVVRDGGGDRRELKRAADLVRSSGGNLVGFVWNEAGKNGQRPQVGGPVVPANRPGISAPAPKDSGLVSPTVRLSAVESLVSSAG
ncbi:MAG: GumC family protein [Verrucomicrobiales bacterium]|nr:polysaccharide biosynthesis tyrosine autokinase [Verrucomicrobiota bacterium JB025]